jgi:hypothetical protein
MWMNLKRCLTGISNTRSNSAQMQHAVIPNFKLGGYEEESPSFPVSTPKGETRKRKRNGAAFPPYPRCWLA